VPFEQILKNDIANETLTIHWFEPTPASKERTAKYHMYNFKEENIEVSTFIIRSSIHAFLYIICHNHNV
jgi:hypothetical protein